MSDSINSTAVNSSPCEITTVDPVDPVDSANSIEFIEIDVKQLSDQLSSKIANNNVVAAITECIEGDIDIRERFNKLYIDINEISGLCGKTFNILKQHETADLIKGKLIAEYDVIKKLSSESILILNDDKSSMNDRVHAKVSLEALSKLILVAKNAFEEINIIPSDIYKVISAITVNINEYVSCSEFDEIYNEWESLKSTTSDVKNHQTRVIDSVTRIRQEVLAIASLMDKVHSLEVTNNRSTTVAAVAKSKIGKRETKDVNGNKIVTSQTQPPNTKSWIKETFAISHFNGNTKGSDGKNVPFVIYVKINFPKFLEIVKLDIRYQERVSKCSSAKDMYIESTLLLFEVCKELSSSDSKNSIVPKNIHKMFVDCYDEYIANWKIINKS